MVEKYSQTIRLSNLKGLFRHGCDPHAKSKKMREKYACIPKLASKTYWRQSQFLEHPLGVVLRHVLQLALVHVREVRPQSRHVRALHLLLAV